MGQSDKPMAIITGVVAILAPYLPLIEILIKLIKLGKLIKFAFRREAALPVAKKRKLAIECGQFRMVYETEVTPICPTPKPKSRR
jgi:hypothetical protein